MTADEAAARYTPESGIILDVRNPGEYEKGHVAGSVNIPVDELRGRIGELQRDKEIFVHCAVGFPRPSRGSSIERKRIYARLEHHRWLREHEGS